MPNIVIFGGTFNPPHQGHYEMITALCELKFIDKVLVVPTKTPPHKDCDYLAPQEHRLAMIKLLCEDFIKTEVSLVDMEREGKSYSIDTVLELKKQYPDYDFYFAIGGDMLATLDTWYKWDELIKETSFIAFSRGDEKAFLADFERMSALGADITMLDEKITDVSSTSLRDKLDPNLIPHKVYDYILKHKLYDQSANEYFDKYSNLLAEKLDEPRYKHSLAVAKKARELAQKYGCDEELAYTAGLLHDITKNATKEEHFDIFKKSGVVLSELEKNAKKLWHAMSGAEYVRSVLNISNPEIYDAIRYHTTGKAGMSLLSKIVFLADFASEDRNYSDVDIMRLLADTDVDMAMKYALAYTINVLVNDKRAVHPDALEAYNEIVMKGSKV